MFIVHSFMCRMHYSLPANLRHLQTIALCDMWWFKSLFISFAIRIKIWIFNLIFIHFRFNRNYFYFYRSLAFLECAACSFIGKIRKGTGSIPLFINYFVSQITGFIFRMPSSNLFHFLISIIIFIIAKDCLTLQRAQPKLKIKI